jgi:hemoglobin
MKGNMPRRGSLVLMAGLCAAGVLLAFAGQGPVQAAPAGTSLYARLGGYDAIAAVVDDFLGRLATDPQFQKFFVGHSQDSIHRIRQLIVDQFCQVTGGPCAYTGRDMKTAHKGLGITEADWNASVKHLTASLDKLKVPEKEKGELLAIASSLKGDIVEKR